VMDLEGRVGTREREREENAMDDGRGRCFRSRRRGSDEPRGGVRWWEG
jgi:hypothetical protein